MAQYHNGTMLKHDGTTAQLYMAIAQSLPVIVAYLFTIAGRNHNYYNIRIIALNVSLPDSNADSIVYF